MRYKGYKWMFIGTLLVIFNIQLGGLVIFPDIVGYIVIAIGVGNVVGAKSSLPAQIASFMAWTMVIGEGLSWFVVQNNYGVTIWTQGMILLIGIINLALRYSVLEVEKENLEDESEKQSYRVKQRNYLILHTVALVVISCQINFTSLGVWLIVLSFVREIYWLGIIYSLKKKYEGESSNSNN